MSSNGRINFGTFIQPYLAKLRALDQEKLAIILILLIFIIRGVIYATIFPLWYAPDEPHHFLNIAHLAKKYAPDVAAHSSLKGIPTKGYYPRPSLYYWLCLPSYLILAQTGIAARAYAIRFISIILGAITVFFGYKTAKEIFSNNKFIVLGTPIFICFLPMFTHITSTINTDNLAIAVMSFFLWISIRSIRQGLNLPRFAGLLASSIIGIYTKRTAFFSMPLLLCLPAFLMVSKQNPNRPRLIKRLLLALVVLLSGGLLILAVNILGYINIPFWYEATKQYFINHSWKASAPGHWQLFWMTFWADFGWADVPIALNYYDILEKVCLLPLVGLFFLFFREKFSEKKTLSRVEVSSIIFLAITLILSILTNLIYIEIVLNTVMHKASAVLQGRYIFPSIIAIAFLFVLGISGLLTSKYYRIALLVFASTLFLFDAMCVLRYIIPHYYAVFNLTVVNVHPHYTQYRPAILNNIYFYNCLFFIYIALLGFLGYKLFEETEEA